MRELRESLYSRNASYDSIQVMRYETEGWELLTTSPFETLLAILETSTLPGWTWII